MFLMTHQHRMPFSAIQMLETELGVSNTYVEIKKMW